MPDALQQENSSLAEVVAVIQQQTTSAFSHTALLTQVGLCLWHGTEPSRQELWRGMKATKHDKLFKI
jgi:hypothetical protein